MNIRKFNVSVGVAGVGFAVLAIVGYYLLGMGSALYILHMPMEAASRGLRGLSLSSEAGNIVAWILYVALCMIPVGYIFYRNGLLRYGLFRKKSSKVEEENRDKWKIAISDGLMLLLSPYLFYLFYCFINPGALVRILPLAGQGEEAMIPMLKSMLSVIAYSLCFGSIIIRLAENFKSGDVWKRTQQILMACTFVYVGFACYVMPFDFFTSLDNPQINDINGLVILLGYFLELLPMVCLVGIIQAGILLIKALSTNKYDGSAVAAATVMTKRSRNTVIIAVLCNIIENIVQLIFSGKLLNVNFRLDISFSPLILAFVGLLVVEYLKESSLLYDDSQMII